MNRHSIYRPRRSASAILTAIFLLIAGLVLAPAADGRTTIIKFPHKSLVRVDKRLSYVTVDNIKVTFENENATVDLYQIISNEFVVYPCNIPIEADTAITSVTFNYSEGEIAIRGQKTVLEPGVAKTYDVSRNLKRVTMSVREMATLYSIVVETAGGDIQEPDPGPTPDPGPEPDPEPVTHTVTVNQPSEGGSISVTDIEGSALDLRSVADGTRLLVKATPDEGYELERIMANGADITATGEVTVAADMTITATFARMSTLRSVSARISCADGDASAAGRVGWKLKGAGGYDSPVKVESGKVITVSVRAADGYCITEASGMTLSAESKVKDLTYDLTINADTEITATFKAIAKGVLALSPTVTGLPSEIADALNVAVFRHDGTPLSASAAIEAGSKIRIVATLGDDRYLFTSMKAGARSAAISADGSSATIDNYVLEGPVSGGSGAVYPVELAIAADRRTVIVNYTADADNVTLTVHKVMGNTGNTGNMGNRVTPGERVPTDTELLFRAVPEEGYEIEAMTVTAGAGNPVVASPADIDEDGACVLSVRTPRTTSVNLAVNYSVSVICRSKDDSPVYRQHTVTLAVAAGQEDWGAVRFTDPTDAGLTVSTRSKVTFEAIPAQLPADGRLGRYSFAGWSNNASVSMEDASGEIQSYGGDDDVTFTAHFTRNCRILFTTSPDNGSMEITRQDGSALAGGDFVEPESTVTVTVTATESDYRVSAITVNGAEAYRYSDNPRCVSQQITVGADMLIGCVITLPSGIAPVGADDAMQPVGWFTLQGVALGAERPVRTGIYIAVFSDGHAAKIAVAE